LVGYFVSGKDEKSARTGIRKVFNDEVWRKIYRQIVQFIPANNAPSTKCSIFVYLHLEKAARVNSPAACCGVYELQEILSLFEENISHGCISTN